jgi:excinuclease ABC subunit A
MEGNDGMKGHSDTQHYIQQSVITDPRQYGFLFDELPRDIPCLVKICQDLIVNPKWEKYYSMSLSNDRRQEMHLRSIPEMLERLVELDSSPLSTPRKPEMRLIGLCRNFAVLLVSILRHQGIPARLRIGFAGYFGSKKPRYWDHRITEYWSEKSGRWVLVDPMIDNVQRRILRLQIDTLDINENSPFLTAGDVWLRCRAGQADPVEFGDSPSDLGMPPIRYALLHDFDALNKVELVGFDTWHDLIDKPELDLTLDELAFLDEVARVTSNVDARFRDLQALYQTSAYGQVTQRQLVQTVGT